MADPRQETLRSYVRELLAVERELEAAFERQRDALKRHPDAAAAFEGFHATASQHREALSSYLEGTGRDGKPRGDAASTGEARTAADALRAAYVVLNDAAIGYAVLFEMALRLYEPPLRELAPKHLREYAEAAQTINQIIARVVAAELAAAGLECSCICPMCSLGACGCVALGTAGVNAAWRETAPNGEAGDGFPLQPPRAGSGLALAGVEGGDRLLEVDGEPVRSIPEIQAAIRKHPIGDDVRLLVQQGSETREIHVKHVGDYPQT